MATVRRAQGPLQLRLPAPGPRGCARTTRARSSSCPTGLDRCRGAAAARVGRGGGQGRRHRRARQRARGTPTASGARSASATASASAPRKCAYGDECFAERARRRRHARQLVVTNHSLLAIDAIEGVPMIPEYDVVVVDEAHELVARVTQAATDELSPHDVDRAARRAQRHVDSEGPGRRPRRRRRGAARRRRLARTPAGSSDPRRPRPTRSCCVRDAARAADQRVPEGPRRAAEVDAGATQARAGPGLFAHRRADGRRLRVRRALVAERERPPRRQPALRRSAGGRRPDAREAAHRQDGRVHLRDAQARRGLRSRRRRLARSRGHRPRAGRGRGRARRRLAVRLRPAGASSTSPSTCRRPAATGWAGPARRDRRAGRRRRRPHPRAVLQPRAAPRPRPRTVREPAAAPDHAAPGRGPAARAGPAVRQRPAHLPVRHAAASGRGSTSPGRPASWC